jgi:hypothetical protein
MSKETILKLNPKVSDFKIPIITIQNNMKGPTVPFEGFIPKLADDQRYLPPGT